MASYHEIPKPERPRGSTAEQIVQLYRYQLKLAEALQNILNDIAKEGEKKDG